MPFDKTNRRLYVDTSVSPNKGISLQDVSNCLRDFRRNKKGEIDLGMMCTSPQITVWPKFKPVRFPSYKVLTEEDMRDVNYGIDFSNAHDDTRQGLIQKAINSNGEYGYLRPRGGESEPFRLLDFNGYNHNAEPPYRYTVEHQKGSADGWLDISLAPKADLTLSDLDPTELPTQDINSCNIVLLLKKEGSTSEYKTIFAVDKETGKQITLADIKAWGESVPVIRFEGLTAGKWYLVIAITDIGDYYPEEDMDGNFFMFLPNALFRLEYDPNYVGFEWFFPSDVDSDIVARKPNGGSIFDTDTDVDSVLIRTCISVLPDTKGFVGKVLYEIGEYGEEFLTYGEYKKDFELAAGRSKEFEAVFNGVGTLFGEPQIDNIYVTARVEYKAPNAENFKYAYFNFLTGKLDANYQYPVSIKQIYDTI